MQLTGKLMLVAGVTLAAVLIADTLLGSHASGWAVLVAGVGWCALGAPICYLIWRIDPKGLGNAGRTD